MKPKLEKNFFIQKIIDCNQSPNPKIKTKSKNITETKENYSYNIYTKNCYIKPHPIFIISNSCKKNQFYFDRNFQKEENNFYIKSNNTERHKYLNIKKRIEKKFIKKESIEELNIIRSNSYEIPSFEHISKIKKYFNDKYDKIKIKLHIHDLNTINKSQEIRNEKYINYFQYKNSSLDILDKANQIKLKSSNSKDIINLCKVLKSFESSNDNSNEATLIKEESLNGSIISLNKDSFKRKKIRNKYFVNLKIILIQKTFKGYLFRKKFKQFWNELNRFCKPNILDKIILLQKFWKNYITNNNKTNLSFSFKKDKDNNSCSKNINNIKNNIITKKSYFHIKKLLIKPCFITKILYSEYNSIIMKITKLQKFIIKYLSNKRRINFYKSINIHNIYKKISPEKEFQDFSFHTPKKEKIKKYKFENVLNNNYSKNNNYKNSEIILNKQIIEFCYISKERKNINLVQKIKYLQKYIIKNRKKRLHIYGILKNVNNICYIDKINRNYLINENLKRKIINLQIHIKRFLKINKNINNNLISNKLIQNTNKKYKDKQTIDNFQSTKEISDNKIGDISQNNNNINLSEFSPNEKINQTRNNNLIISNNLTTFSFDFNRIKNENLEDEDCAININDNCDDINIINNFYFKNMFIASEKIYFFKKLKSLFITSITNKFAYFLIIIMNKLLLYNFIKIFIQKIKKYINQYVFFSISKKNNKNNEINFFNILRRHLKYNIKYIDDNEIRNLLIENMPKVFHKSDENVVNIPFINTIQENNLINAQLFINNDDEMINYFNNFYIKDKGYFSLNEKLLNEILSKYKLKNRNIFTLTNYFDSIYELIINNKLCKNCFSLKSDCNCKDNINKISNFNYIKKKCNYIKMMNNSKRKSKKEENINDEFFKMIDEDKINADEIEENKDLNFNKTLNKYKTLNCGKYDYSNLNTFHKDNSSNIQEYKFFGYINEKFKNKKYNETLPLTHRTDVNSFL